MSEMLDDLDARIIDALTLDIRTSLRTIAHSAGVSIGTVNARIRRLIDHGVIRLVGAIDPNQVGIHSIATVAFKTAGSVRAAADQVRRASEVMFLASTPHRFGLVAEMACADDAALLETIGDLVERCPGVTGVDIWRHLYVVKWESRDRNAAPMLQIRPPADAIDDIGRATLSALIHNPRITATELSRDLEITYSAAKRTLRQMLQAGTVAGTVVYNRPLMQNTATAFLGVRASGNLSDIATRLSRLETVEILVRSSGSFQFIAEITADDLASLGRMVDTVVSPLDGVEAVDLRPYAQIFVLPAPWRFSTP